MSRRASPLHLIFPRNSQLMFLTIIMDSRDPVSYQQKVAAVEGETQVIFLSSPLSVGGAVVTPSYIIPVRPLVDASSSPSAIDGSINS